MVKTQDEIFKLREGLKNSSKEKYSFKCQICGKEASRRIFSKTTELVCSSCKNKKTLLQKYGVENMSQIQAVKEKKKQTTRSHFGVDNPMQSENVVKKLKQNNLANFGVDNLAKLDSVKEKMKSTCKEKFGVEFFAKSEEYKKSCKETWDSKSQEEKESIIEKRKQTSLRNHGVENFNNREKYKQTCFEKFGQFNPMQVESIKAEIESRNLEKYGVKYPMELPEVQERLRQMRLEKPGNGCSAGEKEIQDFLTSLGVSFKVGDRLILDGKELDIEYNGLYWHSDYSKAGNLFPTEEEKKKAKFRHLEKTKLCEEKGIRLIHIFSDDWKFKKDILKSILKNALGFPEKKLFARKCSVKNISLDEYGNFLKENHLQGYSFADLRLGLFYKGELVQCVGVNTKGTHSNEPELVRMCIKKGYSVIGGFSKLMKHLNLKRVVSHVDISIFSGVGYRTVGFKEVKLNPPTYFYTKGTIREPRYHFMRKHIEEKFKKGELGFFDPNLTEENNMYANGYARIWNCGTLKVEWESII